MPDYLSGSTYFTGLGNGTNFDDLILRLKKIELRRAEQLGRWLDSPEERVAARARFAELRRLLGPPGAASRVARHILEDIHSR